MGRVMSRSKSVLQDPSALILSPSRLAAVRKTGLLDTPPEPAFDELTELAAKVLDVPAAFLCLVDEQRDFFKSLYGFGEPMRSLRQLQGRTLCHHTILEGKPLILHDTSEHPILRDVPVVQRMGIASYAAVPLYSEDGQALGTFGVADFEPRTWTKRDTGLLKKMAASALREIKLSMALQELRAKAEENRRAAMSREEFLARVAHDLRNPLSSATIGIALLEYAKLDAQESRTLQLTRQVLDSMNVIIEDLLSVSQFESGKFKLKNAPIESVVLVRDACEVLASLAESNRISLQVEAPADLPPVVADYERVLRIFSNLVGNAIKFCPAESTVRLSAVQVEDKVRFEVADNGPGIPQANVSRLFESFWQSDGADQRGLGLGLSIVKAIVEAHQGEVGVQSVLGEGATFWFSLPVSPGRGKNVRVPARRQRKPKIIEATRHLIPKGRKLPA
jgi:signal transduction histidine kinase